jgi:hypothetical protein
MQLKRVSRMPSSGIRHRGLLISTNVSEERVVSIIRMGGICELGTTLAASNVPSALIFPTLMMKAVRSSETSVLPEPHVNTSKNTTFFIVTAVKTSNLTKRMRLVGYATCMKLAKKT